MIIDVPKHVGRNGEHIRLDLMKNDGNELKIGPIERSAKLYSSDSPYFTRKWRFSIFMTFDKTAEREENQKRLRHQI
jgi:hypothetical protein